MVKNRSLEKTNARLLEDISKRIDNALKRNPGKKPVVLEVGAGNGVSLHQLALNPKYHGKVEFIGVNHDFKAALRKTREAYLRRKSRKTKKPISELFSSTDFHASALGEIFKQTGKKPIVKKVEHLPKLVIADASKIELKPETIDVAFSSMTAPFFDDKAAALERLYRSLKRGGVMVVNVDCTDKQERVPFRMQLVDKLPKGFTEQISRVAREHLARQKEKNPKKELKDPSFLRLIRKHYPDLKTEDFSSFLKTRLAGHNYFYKNKNSRQVIVIQKTEKPLDFGLKHVGVIDLDKLAENRKLKEFSKLWGKITFYEKKLSAI